MHKFLIFNIIIISIANSAETIPFKVKTKTTTQAPMNKAMGGKMAMAMKDDVMLTQIKEVETVVNIATDKIAKAIEEVRAGICATMKNGSIKVWFKGEETGKLVLVESSAEAGLEIQMNCINGK